MWRLDGEIVALDDKGNADFGALQNWRNSNAATLAYFVFDILWYEGKLLTGLPLYQRRELLKSVLRVDNKLIRLSQAFDANGIGFFEELSAALFLDKAFKPLKNI